MKNLYEINENAETWKFAETEITKFIGAKQIKTKHKTIYKPINLPDRIAYLQYIDGKEEGIYNLTVWGWFWFLNYETTKYYESKVVY